MKNIGSYFYLKIQAEAQSDRVLNITSGKIGEHEFLYLSCESDGSAEI